MNENVIIASSNMYIKVQLEPDGDTQTQVYGLQSWTLVEFVSFIISLPKKGATPNTDRYLYYFSSKIITRNCPAVGWVQGNFFE